MTGAPLTALSARYPSLPHHVLPPDIWEVRLSTESSGLARYGDASRKLACQGRSRVQWVSGAIVRSHDLKERAR